MATYINGYPVDEEPDEGLHQKRSISVHNNFKQPPTRFNLDGFKSRWSRK